MVKKVVKVSIILPVYNVEQFLPRCLDSIVNQTLKEIECIVVNDGSPDQSQQIIDEYVKKYPHLFKPLIKENGGLSDARNYALSYVRGEYIAFVDSDDWIEPMMYEKLYQKAKEENADLVVSDFLMEWEDRGVSNYIQGLRQQADNPFKNLLLSPASAWNKLYKTELFTKTNIRYPKGLWYEDLATTAKFMPKCHHIAYVNEAFVHYIQREGSIMSTVNPKVLDIYKAIDSIESYYKQQGIFDEYMEELAYLSIENLALFSCLRFLKLEDGETYIKEAIDHMNRHYPGWLSNQYLSCLSKKDRFTLKLLGHKQIKLLKSFIFIKQKLLK